MTPRRRRPDPTPERSPAAGSPPPLPTVVRLLIRSDWFEAHKIASDLLVFHEPRHYEKTNASLLLGEHRAVLIDTGCGIGDLRQAVAQVTPKPVLVVNTHTHLDHLGCNSQFDEIAMLDHPLSRRVATEGVPPQVARAELLADHLVTGPWPRGFDPESFELPPFEVDRWLRDGDVIPLDDLELEVIHTPGEAPDHICLLERRHRILFCGDVLLHGPVWTHLEGGGLEDLIRTYRNLMLRFDEFDYLMPGHNEAPIDKNLLPEALAGAEKVAAGDVRAEEVVDPWGRRAKRYPFGRFEILTAWSVGAGPV